MRFVTFCKNSSPFHLSLYLTNDPACGFTLIQEFPYPVAISLTVNASLTHVEGKDWLGHVTERARTLLRVGKCAPLSRGDSSLDRSHSQICGTSLIFRLAVANNQAPSMSVNQFSLDEFVFLRTQDAGGRTFTYRRIHPVVN